MRRASVCLAASMAFFLCATALAGYKKYQVVGGPKDFYFGHISFVESDPAGENPTIWREGAGSSEQAVVNAPLSPGDVVRTPDNRRCEIQFDTGTILRLDVETELKIETVYAHSLSTNKGLSNLVLTKGRVYLMYRQYDSHEVFQILTANAAVKLDHRTVAMVKTSPDGSTEVQVQAGEASALFGAAENERKQKEVRKSERLIILADGQSQIAGSIADTEFEKWNEEINAHFEELHEGKSPLPKPIQNLPDAVFYFAQKYGNAYGEWVWDNYLGYAWRPYVNQVGPSGSWSPYSAGHWTAAAGQLFWIPDEPWGWVPYHLGIWHWEKKLGWVWLPGALFASSWTAWDFNQGFYSWRPWGFFDWYGLDEMAIFFASPFDYMMAGGWPPGSIGMGFWDRSGRTPSDGKPLMTRITKDQLKRGAVQSLPMPKELKNSYRSFVTALKRNDDRALSSLQTLLANSNIVRQDDLKSTDIRTKILTAAEVRQMIVPPVAGSAVRASVRNSYRNAMDAFGVPGKFEVRSMPAPHDPELRGAYGPGPNGPAGSPRSAGGQPVMRFRDWNPDVRVAQRLGVTINYSSQTNVVRCPELRFSSHEASHFGSRLSSSFGVWSPFGGGPGFSGSSNTANSPHGNNNAQTGGQGSSSHGSGGGDVKKN